MVKIETDQKTGEIFVSANVDNDDDDGSSEPLKTQLILSIDKKLFKVNQFLKFFLNAVVCDLLSICPSSFPQLFQDAIELYKITETIIPHRQPVHSAANSNKWYG